MITGADVAAGAILWMVGAGVAAPFIGAFIRRGAREMPPVADPDEEVSRDHGHV